MIRLGTWGGPTASSITVSVKETTLPMSMTPHFSNALDKGESGFVQRILSMTNSKSVMDAMLRVRRCDIHWGTSLGWLSWLLSLRSWKKGDFCTQSVSNTVWYSYNQGETNKLRLLIYEFFGEEAVWVRPESLFVSTWSSKGRVEEESSSKTSKDITGRRRRISTGSPGSGETA